MADANDIKFGNSLNRGGLTVVPVSATEWTLVNARNPNRTFLMIEAVGGACDVVFSDYNGLDGLTEYLDAVPKFTLATGQRLIFDNFIPTNEVYIKPASSAVCAYASI